MPKTKIRTDFKDFFEQLRLQQIEKEYKPGWIWYRILEALDRQEIDGLYFGELMFIVEKMGYRKKWATHKWEELDWKYKRFYFEENKQHKTNDRQWQGNSSNSVEAALIFFETELPVSFNVLKQLYKQKALIYHPDVGGSHQAFIQLQKHYETLKILAN